MNPGDRIRIHMHDTEAGFRIDLIDLTTGQSGSMTASVANGFGHILYEPTSTTCHVAPYAFHPEYSHRQPAGNTWSAHTYNVAMLGRDRALRELPQARRELQLRQAGRQDKGGLDEDDGNNFCVPGSDSLLIQINGCFCGDGDWDGQSYQKTGREPTRTCRDRALHPSPVLFTSPLTRTARRTTPRSPSRPTCRGSRRRTRRTTRRSATGPPARTA